jgi:hypothetical protein
LRKELWTLTQDTATAIETFKKDMASAYGRDDPYAGGTRAPRLSSKAVKQMQSLDVLLTKPPKGVVPQTWDTARQFAMVKPFGGKAATPKLALRSVFAVEFAFDQAVRAEMNTPGSGVHDYSSAGAALGVTWNLLKALSCAPPPPTPTPKPAFSIRAWVTPPVIPYGAYPVLNAEAAPGAVCTASVMYRNGRPPPDFSGDAETAQAGLAMAWSWHEALKNTRGSGTVTCQLGGLTASATATFTVTG